MKTAPKCGNCKFAGHNKKSGSRIDAACYFPMHDKYHKRQYRTMLYTTNSKDFTHCDKHAFMKTIDTWIPKPDEIVKFSNTNYKVLSCSIGGKCRIKKMLLPNKGLVLGDIDVSELTRINPA